MGVSLIDIGRSLTTSLPSLLCTPKVGNGGARRGSCTTQRPQVRRRLRYQSVATTVPPPPAEMPFVNGLVTRARLVVFNDPPKL